MPRKPEQSWFQNAVEAFVREKKALRNYALENGLELTGPECDKIFHSKRFQDMIWAERQRFQTEIAQTPGRNKTSLLGLATLLIQNLIEEGQWDKALLGIEKLAKIEGWAGGDSNINIFQGVTSQDIEKMKAELLLPKGDAKPAELAN